MRMHISIPMLFKCTCYAAHAQKPHFNSNHKVWARLKRTSSEFRNRLDLWLTRSWWSTELDWSQLSINNALRTPLRKRMFNQGSTSIESFQDYQQHLGLQSKLAAMTRFLVRPTAIADQSGHGTLGLLTTLHSDDSDFIPDRPISKGGIFHSERLWLLRSRLNSRFTLDIFNFFLLRWSRNDRFWGWND
jgi:hypothetical protein